MQTPRRAPILGISRAAAGSALRLTFLTAAVTVWALACAPLARAAECPDVLSRALRLALVTTKGMETAKALLTRFTRTSTDTPWTQEGEVEPAVVGTAGLGWGAGFESYGGAGEPIKVEGDRRTPAGVFGLGASFGFAASLLPGHIVLRPNKAVCIDDVRSPHYNSIRTRADAGSVSGEEMWRIPLYRSGIIVDYPTDREKRRGSCIFVHIWRSPNSGTAGCIAMPRTRVKALQSFASPGAVIAILPASTLSQFNGCLPAPREASGTEHSPR